MKYEHASDTYIQVFIVKLLPNCVQRVSKRLLVIRHIVSRYKGIQCTRQPSFNHPGVMILAMSYKLPRMKIPRWCLDNMMVSELNLLFRSLVCNLQAEIDSLPEVSDRSGCANIVTIKRHEILTSMTQN